MMYRLKTRADCYDNWSTAVTEALEASDENKLGMYHTSFLYAPMDSSFWFETINLGWSIVDIKGSQVIISK